MAEDNTAATRMVCSNQSLHNYDHLIYSHFFCGFDSIQLGGGQKDRQNYMALGYETGNFPFYKRPPFEPYYKDHTYVPFAFNCVNYPYTHNIRLLFAAYAVNTYQLQWINCN